MKKKFFMIMKHSSVFGIISILGIMLVASGCHNPKGSALSDFKIEVVPGEDTLRVSDWFSSINEITLTGCVVGEINEVVRFGDHYYASGQFYDTDENGNTSESQSLVSEFDEAGRLIKHLIKQGRGPEEMLNVLAIKINPYNQCLEILGDYGQRLCRVDLSTSAFKGGFSIGETEIIVAENFAPLSDGMYAFYKNLPYSEAEEYKVYVYDEAKSSVICCGIPLEKDIAELVSMVQKNNLFCFDDKVLFYECFMNTMFEVKQDTIAPFLTFASNEYLFPETALHENYRGLNEFVERCRESDWIWSHQNFYPLKEILISTYRYQNCRYINLIDTEKKQSHSFRFVYEDIKYGLVLDTNDRWLSFVGSDNNEVILAFDSFALNLVHERNNEEPEEDNGIFKLVTLAR